MNYFVLTFLALLAFAGNSILCRLALGSNAIDAASFTSIRLLAGACVLVVLLGLREGRIERSTYGDSGWAAPLLLFVYAIGFSYAYLSLETGTGALILFASVQITILASGVLTGNKLIGLEWLGMAAAFGGFVYLVKPGIEAPPVGGFILMAGSGMAWGLYTLMGKRSKNPLADTANNFLKALPFALVFTVFTLSYSQFSFAGVLMAALSGGIASGVGYTIWYMALEGITATQAAVVQLFAPVLAAFGGIVFAGEALTSRLAISSIVILGGIALVILGRYFVDQKGVKQTSR